MAAHIANDLYVEIVRSLPIACVDVLIRRDNLFLLVKRANEPLRGEWWVPGGRILKGESAAQAVTRKVYAETGLAVTYMHFCGFHEGYSDRSAQGVTAHWMSLIFMVEADGNVMPNDEVMQWKWSDRLPDKLKWNPTSTTFELPAPSLSRISTDQK